MVQPIESTAAVPTEEPDGSCECPVNTQSDGGQHGLAHHRAVRLLVSLLMLPLPTPPPLPFLACRLCTPLSRLCK